MECRNSEIEKDGIKYHIQTESWAPNAKVLVSQVFVGGRIVFKEKRDLSSFDEGVVSRAIEGLHSDVLEKIRGLLI